MGTNRIVFLAIAAGVAYVVWVEGIVRYAAHKAAI
jgi:hypothetical protein